MFGMGAERSHWPRRRSGDGGGPEGFAGVGCALGAGVGTSGGAGGGAFFGTYGLVGSLYFSSPSRLWSPKLAPSKIQNPDGASLGLQSREGEEKYNDPTNP